MNLKAPYTPADWKELQELLFLHAHNDALDRIRSPFIYRGLSDITYELRTSLMRMGGGYLALEKHLLRNFKKYAHNAHPQGTSDWHWLALAQHHGLPTRLLDWTYSPYTALHFATENIHRYDSDGVIWAFNYERANGYLPPGPKAIIDSVGSNSFTSEMLLQAYPSLEALDRAEGEFVIIFESASLDQRIVNQYALFSMMSTADGILSNWLETNPDLHFRIRIPAEMKWEIRDRLDQANINERVLFPGLQGLSKWLKRHYSSKQNPDNA
jgi:hypothetical protein